MPVHFFDTQNDGTTIIPMSNLYRFVSSGLNPTSTAADIVLATFSLPAYFFNAPNKGVDFYAQGNFASNVNTKTVKIIVGATAAVVGSAVSGGTTIGSGTYSTTGAAGWTLCGSVYKYGVYGSNTQVGIHTAFQAGATVGALAASSALTFTESSVIICAVTGNAATTATDIALNLFEVDAMNV